MNNKETIDCNLADCVWDYIVGDTFDYRHTLKNLKLEPDNSAEWAWESIMNKTKAICVN